MKKDKSVEGLSSEMVHRYLATRKVIDRKADRIANIAHLLALLEHCAEESIPVNPKVLASFAETIHADVCAIIECLDAFAFVQNQEMEE